MGSPLGSGGFPFPFPFPFPGSIDSGNGMGGLTPASAFFNQLIQLSPFSQAMGLSPLMARGEEILPSSQEEGSTREALKFILSPQGAFFRDFVLDEVVKSIDALSREQLVLLVQQLGLQAVMLPVLIPGKSNTHAVLGQLKWRLGDYLSPYSELQSRIIISESLTCAAFLSAQAPGDPSL